MRDSRGRLLDIGTGAGYPGIPIDICSSVNVTMIDSVGKKVRALQSFVDELGLDSKSECIKSRAEELAQQQSGSFEYVTARAVAQLSTLIEYATPFLVKSGKAIFSKGRMSDDEIEQAQITAKICGMKLVSRKTFELPDESGHRELLTYVRERDSKVNLPRRNGLAKSEPLYLRHY
jgi:16S rRNA (guanine527-N7)-methyltransferase